MVDNEYAFIESLESIDFSYRSNKDQYSFIENHIIPSLEIKGSNRIQEIKSISHFSDLLQETAKKVQIDVINELKKEIEIDLLSINKFNATQNKIVSIYNSTVTDMSKNDTLSNDVLKYYMEYQHQNKSNLIRKEILNHFLSELNLNKEDKELLTNKPNTKSDEFFSLLLKVKRIRENISLIEKNSEHYSKNLLLSLKENIVVIEDLINENIIVYIKNLFKQHLTSEGRDESILGLKRRPSTTSITSNSTKLKSFSFKEFKNMLISIHFAKSNSNYEIFLQKEYLIFRKKVIDDTLKTKYIKLTQDYESKLDSLIVELSGEYEFLLLREILLMYTLFYNDIYLSDELKEILDYVNIFNLQKSSSTGTESREEEVDIDVHNLSSLNKPKIDYQSKIEGEYRLLQKIIDTEKDSQFNFKNFITGLNTIFYPLSEWMYENFNFIINSLSDNENCFSSLLKVTALFESIIKRLDRIFLNLNIPNSENQNIDIYSLLSNSSMKFSKMFSKTSSDIQKKLAKNKSNIINILFKEKEGENGVFGQILKYANDYSIMFKTKLSIDPYNNLDNLISQQAFCLILTMFDEIVVADLLEGKYIFNNRKQSLATKLINYYYKLYCLFKEYSSSLSEKYSKIEEKFNYIKISIIDFLYRNIINETEFEEGITKIISQEQGFNFVENISEKCQYLFIFIDQIQENTLKEEIKEMVKNKIICLFKQITQKHDECLYVLTEEDFKGFIN